MSNAFEQPLPAPDPSWTASPKARSVEYALTRDDVIEAFLAVTPDRRELFTRRGAFWVFAVLVCCGVLVTTTFMLFFVPQANAPRGESIAYLLKAGGLLVIG